MGLAKFTGVLFLLLIVMGGSFILVPKYQKYKASLKDLRATQKEVVHSELGVNEYRAQLHDLRVNPAAVERVAREKFGLCRKGERVVVFKDDARYREQLEE